jgi:hypothetical protein
MKTYEEWVATRFVNDRVFSDEIANIIRDGPLRLPERKGWQIYMTPQMQNFRELAHMKTADEGRANQRLLCEENDDVKRNNDPGPAVDVGFVAETVSSQNGAAPAMQQFAEGLARSDPTRPTSTASSAGAGRSWTAWPRRFVQPTRGNGSRMRSTLHASTPSMRTVCDWRGWWPRRRRPWVPRHQQWTSAPRTSIWPTWRLL